MDKNILIAVNENPYIKKKLLLVTTPGYSLYLKLILMDFYKRKYCQGKSGKGIKSLSKDELI